MASPVQSMTGYGLATREIALTTAADDAPSNFATVSVELRSVNSRFLDINFRSPDECRGFEPPLREQVTAAVRRGKLDCRIALQRAEGKGGASALNPAVLQQLRELEQSVAASFPGAGTLRMGEILRWPGLIAEGVLTQEALREAVLACGTDALAQLKESRRREGAALKVGLLERVEAMLAIVARLTPLVPQLVVAHQQKLTERLQEALDASSGNGTATMSRDEIADRIRQEVVMYGIRIDVAEELSRLEAHLKETAHILETGGPVGKRLDFMMQELNREANTIGSKAAAKEPADASMELKLLIEQMREQVQNLE